MSRPLIEQDVENVRDPALDLFKNRLKEAGKAHYEISYSAFQNVYNCVDLLISSIRAGKTTTWEEVPAFLASRMQAHDEYEKQEKAPSYRGKAEEGKLAVLCVAELLKVKAQTEEIYKAQQEQKGPSKA